MANYELGAGGELYVEGVYTNTIVVTKRAATPVGGSHRFQVNSPFLPGGVQDLLRALDETEGNAATRGDGFTNLSIGRRISEGGTRDVTFERDAWRIVNGIRGDIGSLRDRKITRLNSSH